MSSEISGILKSLKEICHKIKTEKNYSQYANQLRVNFKGDAYEFYSLKELLDLLSQNVDLPEANKAEVIKLLDELLHDGSNNKDLLIGSFYNFLIQHKNRPDVISDLIPICKFHEFRETKNPEYAILMTEFLLRTSETKLLSCHRSDLYKNYVANWKNYGMREETMESIERIMHEFAIDLNWDLFQNFLDEVLLSEDVMEVYRMLNNVSFEGILRIFIYLLHYGKCSEEIIKMCQNFTVKLTELVSNEDQKECSEILLITFNVCCESTINKSTFNELYNPYMKFIVPRGVVLHQRTAAIVSKLLKSRISQFELTEDCFAAFHRLCIRMFRIFKSAEDKEEIVQCCADIKRHESHGLIASIFRLAQRFTTEDIFTSKIASYFLYHVRYDITICSGLKCQSRNKELLNIYYSIYAIVGEFTRKTSLLQGNLMTQMDSCVKILLELWIKIPSELKSSGFEADLLALKIYDLPWNKTEAVICANGIASLITNKKMPNDDVKMRRKYQMKFMSSLRTKVMMLDFPSAADFFRSVKFVDSNFNVESIKPSIVEIIQLEVGTLSRYCPTKTKEVGKLFTELLKETENPLILAQSCQSINDYVIKTMDFEKIINLNKLLKQEAERSAFNLEISLALALNNYWIYFMKSDVIANELKEGSDKYVDKLNLREELELLKYLNESLENFTDIVSHLMKNKKDLDLVWSFKRVTTIIHNISVQYYVKGIKYKLLETFAVLWHFCHLGEPEISTLLNIGSYYLDNYESLTDMSNNYIRVSKKVKHLTVEEIASELNQLLDEKFIPNFEEQDEPTQCFILSYLLSLWTYCVVRTNRAEGFKRWDQFKKLFAVMKASKDSSSSLAIQAKINFCLVDINLRCYNRNADNFLSHANAILMRIKSIDREFIYQFYQIYYRITIKSVNFSINRLADMDHYDTVMASVIVMAAKKGNCLKVLELLSLSILKWLNMEKIEHAKVQLKEITKLIGLKEEMLLGTPTKLRTSIAPFDFAIHQATVRKSIVGPQSPDLIELSIIHEDQSSELSRQLESFVHTSSCKCDICKVPQLKFVMFQIGCHYSRLMWLMNKFDVSKKFNEMALEEWRRVDNELRRSKDSEFPMINKVEFNVFSIRWLFQCADTLIRTGDFEDLNAIYQEVELILTINIPDYKCFWQALHCRRENLEFLLEHGSTAQAVAPPAAELSFEKFLKMRNQKLPSTPRLKEFITVRKKDKHSADANHFQMKVTDDYQKASTSKSTEMLRKGTEKQGSELKGKQAKKIPNFKNFIIDLTNDSD